jgi:hypothetical protein
VHGEDERLSPSAPDEEAGEDDRASKPPPGDRPEEGDGGDRPDATEAPGPQGNPEFDEEALRNRQQER